VREAFAEHKLAKHQFAKHHRTGPPGKRQRRRMQKDALHVQLKQQMHTGKNPIELWRKHRGNYKKTGCCYKEQQEEEEADKCKGVEKRKLHYNSSNSGETE
jgi:hypothetical protein